MQAREPTREAERRKLAREIVEAEWESEQRARDAEYEDAHAAKRGRAEAPQPRFGFAAEAPQPRFVGKGVTSAAFSPPLRCADPSDPMNVHRSDPSKVSRYGDIDLLNREMEIYMRLAEADPEFRYHLRAYGTCRAAPLEGEAAKAATGILPPRSPGIMVMDRAGMSFAQLLNKVTVLQCLERSRDDTTPRPAPLVDNVKHLLRGFEVMARGGVLYADFNAGNYVVGEDGLARYIDFDPAIVALLTSPATDEELATGVGELVVSVRDMVDEMPDLETTHPEQYRQLQAMGMVNRRRGTGGSREDRALTWRDVMRWAKQP